MTSDATSDTEGARIIALSIVAGLAVGWVSASVVAALEEDRYERAFEQAASARLAVLGGSLESTLQVSHSIVSFFNASNAVDRSEFATFVGPEFPLHGGIQALEWIPRVPAAERKGHEEQARREVFDGYQINERSADNSIVPAGTRDVYFPVFFLEPLAGNEAALGFDLASNPTRLAALEKARDTGETIASTKINLMQGNGERPGVLIFAPVYQNGEAHDSLVARRASLAGFALAVLDIQSLVASAVETTGGAEGAVEFDLAIFDLGAKAGERLIHSVPSDSFAPAAPQSPEDMQAGVHTALELSVGDRTWLALATPSGPAFNALLMPQPWGVAVPVFLVLVLLGFYLRAIIARNSQVNSLVEDRTENLKAILDTVIDGIITIDSMGVVQTYNPGAERIFGFPAEEVVGMNVRMLMPQPYKQEHDGYLRHFLSTGEARVIGMGREVEGQRKDGSVFPMSLSVGEMTVARKRMFTGVVRDITELKEIEGLKNEFVSTVSHELRTPLTSIKGALGLVRTGITGDLPERLTSMVEIAYTNADRLIRLINDILDMEKIEAGKMDFRLETADLSRIVAESVDANLAYGEEREINFVVTGEIAGALVFADRDRVTQVVTNFLSNAAKFSPRGGTVEISTRMRDQSFRVSVADHGPGIPKDFQGQIFEKFSQADSTDTRGRGGTGLGLSICKAIIERHGGEIGFESVPGKGATFFFDLPSLEPDAAAAEAALIPDDSQKVLICEDEPEVAEWLRLMLEHDGVLADIALDAEEAGRMLRRTDYVAMTLDLNLPGKDGLAFLSELRDDPATRDLPVVIVSVLPPTKAEEINGDAVNVVDWIQKPVDKERLLRGIDRARSRRGGIPKVLHVEDDTDVRDFVERLIAGHAVVTPAETFAKAKRLLATKWFDLVLLDLDLPDGPGQDLLPYLSGGKREAAPPVIVFSASEVSKDVADSIYQALVKSQTSNEDLLSSVRSAIENRTDSAARL